MSLPVPLLLLASIFAAAVSIYFPYGAVVYGRFQAGFDLSAPRASFDKMPDFAKRAAWAHQNCFETFMVYAAAALMAYVTGVNSATAGWAAIAFVVSRFLFSVAYIADIPLLRSLMFGVGSGATTILFVLSLLQAAKTV